MPFRSIISLTTALFFAAAYHFAAADDKTTPPATNTTTVRLTNGEFKLSPNTRWREERIMSAPKFKLSVDLGSGKSVKGSMSLISRQLLDVDVLTDKNLRLKFIQHNSTSDIDIGANRNRNTTTLPLDGKIALAERSNAGRWSAKLDGRNRPTSGEGAALHALTYLWIDGIYPDRDVAIGETWKIDAKELKNLFGADFKKPAGEFEFTLVRMVDHEGHKCAKITGKGSVTSQTKSLGNAAADGTGETPLDATMDISIEIFRSLELAMDMTMKMEGTLDLNNEKDEKALQYKATSPVKFTRSFRKRK